MRPLARKLFLTQGLIILMVFGVSGFAYFALGDAHRRAARLEAEYELGKVQEIFEAELRDIALSRKFYFIEKTSHGDKLAEMRRSFYGSLERLELEIAELANRAGNKSDLKELVHLLRRQLGIYRRAVAEQEMYLRLGDEERFDQSLARAEKSRERMREMINKSSDTRDRIVSSEIDALRAA
ncbi:MAG: hypothetical protein ACE5ID_00675, partial [Acidobacteriota bacterium]